MGAPASAGAGVRAVGRRRVAQLASIASGSKRDHTERRVSARTARPTWCGKVYICRFLGVWFAGSFLITASPDIIGLLQRSVLPSRARLYYPFAR